MDTKPRKYTPTPEELAALKRFAAKNGRSWKSKLVVLWMNGRDDYEEGGCYLRAVRNSAGPLWLYKFSINKFEAKTAQEAF